ncbi:MAG: hypothetical protein ACYTBJ_15455 [Planctomycetota bacterium]|jgi:hypothetical protein
MTVQMTRRDFIRSTAAGSLALTALGPSAISAGIKENRKPNLLFIWTDEQRADTMAVYGNTRIHTPNLNKDPGETTNLFDSGQHQDVIDRLSARIRKWQKKTEDTLVL